MTFFLWVFLVLLYGVVGFKVTEWQTISRLGFQSESPLFYLLKPFLYHWLCYLLFLIIFLFPLFSENIPRWGIIFVLVEAFFIAVKGRDKSLKNYRTILKELLSQAQDTQTKKNLEEKLKLSDIEIWENLKENEKLNTGLLRFRSQ